MSLLPGVLLLSLRSRGVVIILDAEEIVCRAPKGVLSVADVAALREHKPALIAIMAGQCRGCGSTFYRPESAAAGRCTSCRQNSGTP